MKNVEEALEAYVALGQFVNEAGCICDMKGLLKMIEVLTVDEIEDREKDFLDSGDKVQGASVLATWRSAWSPKRRMILSILVLNGDGVMCCSSEATGEMLKSYWEPRFADRPSPTGWRRSCWSMRCRSRLAGRRS